MGLSRIPIILGESHPCPYLPAREARLGWVGRDAVAMRSLYTALVEAGCRRSGSSVYRPYCPACSECVPVRIPVAAFSPNRSQARVWKRNADLRVAVGSAGLGAERYALYHRYQAARHPLESMAKASRGEVEDFLGCVWMKTWFIEFRRDGRLVAVAVADSLDDGLSAVYSFFDPDDSKSSLGTFMILYQIELAKRLGLVWCYLGYWVSGSRKMRYKSHFRPIEARIDGRWTRVEPGQPMPPASLRDKV